MTDETPFKWTASDAAAMARMYREWQAFKAGNPTMRGPGANDGTPQLPTARGLVRPTDKATIDGKPNIWKYTVAVVQHPFVHLLGTEPSPIGSAPGHNYAEIGNTATNLWGLSIASSESAATCGDIYEVIPVSDSYPHYAVEASLYWTYFISGDPADGYWAWWFNLPNMVKVKAST